MDHNVIFQLKSVFYCKSFDCLKERMRKILAPALIYVLRPMADSGNVINDSSLDILIQCVALRNVIDLFQVSLKIFGMGSEFFKKKLEVLLIINHSFGSANTFMAIITGDPIAS